MIQHRHDLGGPAPDGGGHGHDGTAVFAHGCAPDKVHLPAYAGDLAQAHAFGGHLPHEIHLYTGIDAHHVVVLRDDHGVIHMLHRVYLHLRIVVDKVI